jgi:hypothetical protein
MPSDITELVTKAGVISEAMGIGDHTPIDHSPKEEAPLEIDPCIDEETSEEGRIAAETTAAASENKETAASSAAANSDGIPKVGDIYKGKKVGSVEKIPDCNDDKHGVIYIYDENEDIIDTIKY